jgi:hypothetical protein
MGGWIIDTDMEVQAVGSTMLMTVLILLTGFFDIPTGGPCDIPECI